MSAVLTEAVGIGATLLGNLITVIPQGNIGGIQVQATFEETMTDTVRVTDHPVEAGAEISDHAYYRPADLVMRCGWSNSNPASLIGAVENLFSGGGLSQFAGLSSIPGFGTNSSSPPPPISGGGMSVSDYVSGVYAQLLSLQQSLQPFTVVTSLRLYTNVMITSLVVTRDQKTAQALRCTATMRQVIIVNTVASSIPPLANQANPASTADVSQNGPLSLQTGTTPNPGGSPGSAVWPPGSDEAMGIFN